MSCFVVCLSLLFQCFMGLINRKECKLVFRWGFLRGNQVEHFREKMLLFLLKTHYTVHLFGAISQKYLVTQVKSILQMPQEMSLLQTTCSCFQRSLQMAFGTNRGQLKPPESFFFLWQKKVTGMLSWWDNNQISHRPIQTPNVCTSGQSMYLWFTL